MHTAWSHEGAARLAQVFNTNSGEYQLTVGNSKPLIYDPFSLWLLRGMSQDEYPLCRGVIRKGSYTIHDPDVGEVDLPVVSFLYFKADSNGALEKNERLIVLTGMGFGEHPGHKGQPPAEYLVGVQLGTLDPLTHRVHVAIAIGEEIEPKHFSVACIVSGPYGEPVLANSS